jgi:hypothetical protein
MDERSHGSPTHQSQTRLASLGWFVFVALACGHFTLRYLWKARQFLNLQAYAAGAERLPYQGRIFMSWVLHATAASTSLGPKLAHIAAHLPTGLADPYSLVLLVVNFVALLVAVFAARGTILRLTGERRFASWAALLTLYMAYFNLILPYGLDYILPYDLPSLALFSVGVWLVVSGRDVWLLPVFVLGTLNRETFCFMTIFYALYRYFELRESSSNPQSDLGRKSGLAGKNSSAPRVAWLRRAAPMVVAQAVIWLAIRLWLRHEFLGNLQDTAGGNGLFALQLGTNLKSLMKPPQWPLFLSLFGFTAPLLVWGYRWIVDVRGSRALARSIAVIVPLWVAAMFIVGVVVEVRVFNELTAFLAPAVALIVWNRWARQAGELQHGDV